RAPSCLACTASSARYTLSLHDALPIWTRRAARWQFRAVEQVTDRVRALLCDVHVRGLVPAGRHVAGGEVLMTWLLAVMLLPLLGGITTTALPHDDRTAMRVAFSCATAA